MRYTGGLLGDGTTRDPHARLLARHRLTESDYSITQLRYDLGKLRAHGLAERIGRSRRYRLLPEGVRLGVLLVKVRTRLLGPLVSMPTLATTMGRSNNPSEVEAALRQVGKALDVLCDKLGLRLAA